MIEVPALISPSLVGRANKISRRSAKSLLRGAGILELIGGRWYVDQARLRQRLPSVYDRVLDHLMRQPALPHRSDR